jgi:hypothetical protein
VTMEQSLILMHAHRRLILAAIAQQASRERAWWDQVIAGSAVPRSTELPQVLADLLPCSARNAVPVTSPTLPAWGDNGNYDVKSFIRCSGMCNDKVSLKDIF